MYHTRSENHGPYVETPTRGHSMVGALGGQDIPVRRHCIVGVADIECKVGYVRRWNRTYLGDAWGALGLVPHAGNRAGRRSLCSLRRRHVAPCVSSPLNPLRSYHRFRLLSLPLLPHSQPHYSFWGLPNLCLAFGIGLAILRCIPATAWPPVTLRRLYTR